MQCESRDVRVGPRRECGIGVPQDLLRGALIDAVADAERLPGFSEGVEVHHANEIIRVRDTRPLQVRPQAIVRWKSAKER